MAEEKSNDQVYTEVGRASGQIIDILLDSQKEQRATAVAQDGRIRDLEQDSARLSSAITNLLESLTTISHHFEENTATLAALVDRLTDIEQAPRLTSTEIDRVRADQQTADESKKAQRKARTDLRISIKAGVVIGFATLLFSLVSATLIALLITPHIHPG